MTIWDDLTTDLAADDNFGETVSYTDRAGTTTEISIVWIETEDDNTEDDESGRQHVRLASALLADAAGATVERGGVLTRGVTWTIEYIDRDSAQQHILHLARTDRERMSHRGYNA